MSDASRILGDKLLFQTPAESYKELHAQATEQAKRIVSWLKENKSPNHKDWADVEEMAYTITELTQITSRLFGEGEYAESGGNQ